MMDPNKTQLGAPPVADPNRTVMGQAPTIEATITIKPVQCPVCKTFNPAAVMFCVECGLIFDRALPGDAFGAPTVVLPSFVDESGREHPIRPGSQVIGRQGDLVIDDARMSRRHAEVRSADGVIVVLDLGSTNGTKVNGDALVANEPRALSPGDKVSLGGVELVYSLPGEGAKTLLGIGGKTQAIQSPPTAKTAVAKLISDFGVFDLELGINAVGRKDSNQVVIADSFVSGKHGEFDVTELAIFFTDLGSSNGSFVNEARLAANQRTEISTDDVLKLGNLEFRIEWISA